MRTLSATLTAAQTALNKPPLWKVVLSRAAASTRAYDNTRLLKTIRTETPSSNTAELVLNNSDGALTSLDFEHYQAVISYGFRTGLARSAWVAGSAYAIDDMVIPTAANTNGYQFRCSVAGTVAGTTEPTWSATLGITVADSAVTWETDGLSGDEYIRKAPLRIRAQELHSGRGILRCILRAEGITNQLGEDKAEATYKLTAADTQTVKTLFTAVNGTSLSAYANYTGYTVTYDSEDAVIDTFKPADFFSISVNENRFEKGQDLLSYTGSKMRIQNDGQIHILDPVVTGTAYNYEYKFNVVGDHNFWNKTVRNRFVNPNQEIVSSHPELSPPITANSTSATSYALAPKIHTTYARLASTAQAASIASAKIEQYELDAERGFATVPLNAGQELWDYIKVTDSRQNDTRVGNIQYIQDIVEVHFNNQPLTWATMFSFGKVTTQSLMANMLSAGLGTTGEVAARLTNEQILTLFDDVLDKIEEIIDEQEQTRTFINNLLSDEATFRKLTVIDSMTIPSEE